MDLSVLDQVRWIAHWPLNEVRRLYARFTSWQNPQLEDVGSWVMSTSQIVDLMVDAGGRTPMVPKQVAQYLCEMFASFGEGESEDGDNQVIDGFSSSSPTAAMTSSSSSSSSEDSFAVEDEVDMLEFLVGLTLFCDGSLEEKVRFLFELFDLSGTQGLAEDQVFALLETCAQAISKLHGVLRMPSTDEIERWVNEFFVQMNGPFATASLESIIGWVRGSPKLRQVFCLVDCVYAYENLIDTLQNSVAKIEIPLYQHVPPQRSGLSALLENKKKETDPDTRFVNGPCVVLGNQFAMHLEFTVDRTTAVTIHLAVPNKYDTYSLVGYGDMGWNELASFQMECVAGQVCSICLQEAFPIPTKDGVICRITFSRLQQTIHVPFGVPSMVQIASDEDYLTNEMKDEAKLGIVLGAKQDSKARKHWKNGAILYTQDILREDEQFVEFAIGERGHVLICDQYRGPRYNFSVEFRHHLDSIDVNVKQLIVLLNGPPLLGAIDMSNEERRVNEEILHQMSEWLQGRSDIVISVVMNGEDKYRGTKSIIDCRTALQNGQSRISQIILTGSKHANLSRLENDQVSLKGSFQLCMIQDDPLDAVELKSVSGDILQQRSWENWNARVLLGPILGRKTRDGINVLLEIDRPSKIVGFVINAFTKQVVDRVEMFVGKEKPHCFRFKNLGCSQSTRYVVRFHGIKDSDKFGAAFSHDSTSGKMDFIFENMMYSNAGQDLTSWDYLQHRQEWHHGKHTMCHIGGLLPLTDIESYRHDATLLRAAIREWANRPGLKGFLSNCSNVVAIDPSILARNEVLKEYYQGMELLLEEDVMEEMVLQAHFSDGMESFLKTLPCTIGAKSLVVVVSDSITLNDHHQQSYENAISALGEFLVSNRSLSKVIMVSPCKDTTVAWKSTLQDTATEKRISEISVPVTSGASILAMVTSNELEGRPPTTIDNGRFVRNFDSVHPRSIGCVTIMKAFAQIVEVTHSGLGSALLPKSKRNSKTKKVRKTEETKVDDASKLYDIQMYVDDIHTKGTSERFQQLAASLSENAAKQQAIWYQLQKAKDKLETGTEELKRLRVQQFETRQYYEDVSNCLRVARTRLWEARKVEYNRIQDQSKTFVEVSELASRILEELPIYHEELLALRKKVTAKELSNTCKKYSESCTCTKLILEISAKCPEAKEAMIDKANAVNMNGEIRLKRDGSYAFSEDITIRSLQAIRDQFQKNAAKVLAQDEAVSIQFKKVLDKLHEVHRPRVVVAVGKYEFIRKRISETLFEIHDAKSMIEEKTLELDQIHQAIVPLILQYRDEFYENQMDLKRFHERQLLEAKAFNLYSIKSDPSTHDDPWLQATLIDPVVLNEHIITSPFTMEKAIENIKNFF